MEGDVGKSAAHPGDDFLQTGCADLTEAGSGVYN
jgi:hypothetical protein